MSVTSPEGTGITGSLAGLVPGRLSSLPNLVWARFGQFIDDAHRIPLETLSLYRILFASYFLVMNTIPDLRWIAAYPGEFHNPAPGLMNLWSGFPPLPVLIALEVGAVATVCALALGWRTVWTSIAFTVVGLLVNSVYLSFGKIDHTAVVWFLPAILAHSGWGYYWSYDQLKREQGVDVKGSGRLQNRVDSPMRSPGWPTAAAATMLGLAFLSAGLPKVVRGWLSFDSSGAQSYFHQFHFALGRDGLLANRFLDISYRPMWELFDWATVVIELSLAAVIFWPLAHRWGLAAAWLFHLGVMLVMNIAFFGPTPVYALFFLVLVNPATSRRVGQWLLSNRRPATALLVPAAAATLIGRGVYMTVVVEWRNIPVLWAELAYFAVGAGALMVAMITSRGFRQTY